MNRNDSLIMLKNKAPFLILTVFAVLFIMIFYGRVLRHPDHFIFSDRGDGIKNYFTYAWHIKHDTTLLGFSGMNYPYGEHLLYTDCHPAIAETLRIAAKAIPGLALHSIGILNFLLIFSIFLTFFVIYLLLKEFKINSWNSALFSIGITLLAPQIFRIQGHLSLSYSIALPLSWLLLLRYLGGRHKRSYFWLLLLNNLFWMFIHAYLGVMVSLFTGLILIFHSFIRNGEPQRVRNFFTAFLTTLIPLLFFFLLTLFTDPHTGRTDNPSGFLLYNAELDDVFVPHHPPLRPWLDKISGDKIRLQWEAWSYVGISTVILCISLLILGITSVFSKNTRLCLFPLFHNRLLNFSLLSGLMIFLFATGFPFKQFPGLLDIVPIVKPFRATGRFAWPLFFVLSLFSAYLLNEFQQRAGNTGTKIFFTVLIVVAGISQFWEGLPYHQSVHKELLRASNIFRKELTDPEMQHMISLADPGRYQALISLPFFYQGSESFTKPLNDESAKNSFCLAYHSGLPMVCTNLTRTSIPESRKIIQILSPSFYTKPLLNDLSSSRPFLLLRSAGELTQNEQDLLRKCSLVWSGGKYSLYSISVAELRRNNSKDYFSEFNMKRSGYYRIGDFLVDKDSAAIYFSDFEEQLSTHPFRGRGGYSGVKTGKNLLGTIQPGTLPAGIKYEVSIWMFNGMKDALNLWFRLFIEESDAAGNIVGSYTFFPDQAEVINGNWSMVQAELMLKDPGNSISIYTLGKDDASGPFYADDLLMRPSGVNVFRISPDGSRLFYNNHEIMAN